MTRPLSVKERPILFSGPMVRAILDGRKTQTRRVVKIPEWVSEEDAHDYAQIAWGDVGHSGRGFYVWHGEYADEGALLIRCPYGVPGDRLWVKETFFEEYDPITAKPYDPPRAIYAATHEGEVMKMDDDGWQKWRKDGTAASPWTPSIFMPRWASRITLEVTEVRVHRLHETQEDDARAEGVEWPKCEDFEPHTFRFNAAWELDPKGERSHTSGPARCAFERLWNSLNAKRGFSWETNPWVWAVTFRRLP